VVSSVRMQMRLGQFHLPLHCLRWEIAEARHCHIKEDAGDGVLVDLCHSDVLVCVSFCTVAPVALVSVGEGVPPHQYRAPWCDYRHVARQRQVEGYLQSFHLVLFEPEVLQVLEQPGGAVRMPSTGSR
jgi:hypothetical protein